MNNLEKKILDSILKVLKEEKPTPEEGTSAVMTSVINLLCCAGECYEQYSTDSRKFALYILQSSVKQIKEQIQQNPK